MGGGITHPRVHGVAVILVLAPLGALLLAVLFVDVLFTVFHPEGHGGPVHRRQNHLVWLVFRAIGTRRDGAVRPNLLALAGPVIAVLSVGMWGAWLVLGFALVYAPFVSTFAMSAPHVVIGWVEAVYYSGYVASTLGLGDVVAPTPALRLLTVLEAMSGFALFAVATTYVLAVSRELAGANTLALEISSIFRGGLGEQALRRASGGDETLTRWAEEVARSLLRVVHAHGQYPVLHYFRPKDPDRALLVQLGKVLTLVGNERDTDADAPSRGAVPAFQLLRDAVMRYLVEVNHGCVPARFDPLPAPLEEVPAERLHARLLRYLCYEVAPPRAGVLDT